MIGVKLRRDGRGSVPDCKPIVIVIVEGFPLVAAQASATQNKTSSFDLSRSDLA